MDKPFQLSNRITILVKDPGLNAPEFSGIGLLKDDHVNFHIGTTVPPLTAAYHPVPLAYCTKLSGHLATLQQQNKIEDVNTDDHSPWISSVVITEKKDKQQIRMNIDMREANKALKRTAHHTETIQEIRHLLKGATQYSKMDLSHGFHQIALHPDSHYISTFRTHEGLHRFKVLFFRASPASELFHNKIKEALCHLPGCISIHDNILIYGKTLEEHETNLSAYLARIKAKALTLQHSKCTFGATSVSWFGYIFSASGMSADLSKIKAIATAGCPQTTDEVKSFLQACQYNAKFMFDSDQAYAQVTQPLHQLTGKNVRFAWTLACESAYQEILCIMTANTALRPFDPAMKTIMISDAGPVGIAASSFKEEEASTWTPVDHASHSLTPCEQAYAQIEKESLAQSWGMNTHWYYLLGIPFDSYTDHQPLIPIYSASHKPAPARVEHHHHLQVQDFQCTMRYIPGKSSPCDYPSRHPIPLADYTASKIAEMVIDQGDELGINKIITDDLPDAVTLQMIQQATKQDPICQKPASRRDTSQRTPH